MLTCLLLIVASAAAEGNVTTNDVAGKWPADAFFGLHYDLHPNAKDTELGRETTYEHIREQLEKVQPDYVQYDCKGHGGYTGYPTKVGSPSPGIVNDALKIWRQVTHDMGIPLSIHYSGVWDTRAIEVHSEWAKIDADGKPNKNNTCPTSAYTDDYMIPQLLEVVAAYDLDGVWIDGENWASQPCYSESCKAAFTKETGITDIPKGSGDAHWAEWLAFQRGLFVDHVRRYTKALHELKPSMAVCSNWMYSVRQPEPMEVPLDYLSGDFTPSFGAERACAEARFIASRGMPWNLMAWTFLRTGNQSWTTKTPVHLCQEVAGTLAQGGSVFLYNQPQRSGRLTAWHQDVFAEVADFCRARKDYCYKSETIPQVAILHSATAYYRYNAPLFNFGSAAEAMEGALHGLLENGLSVDLLNEEMLLKRMSAYPIVVVPEQAGLTAEITAALKAYAEAGGRVLISGPLVAKELGEFVGVAAAEGSQGGGYLPADNGCVTVTGPWQNVTVTSAKELAPFLNQQEPSLNQAGTPAATINQVGKGCVVAVHGPLFACYNQSHYPRLRRFIGDMVNALDAPGLIRVAGPWWVEMAARQKDGRTLLQFVNRGSAGYLAPNRHMVEQVADTGAFTVTVPMAEKPTRCFTAPDKVAAEWTWKDGLLTVRVGGLSIHNVLVIE
jgi:alpha-L-fucosidase-like protein